MCTRPGPGGRYGGSGDKGLTHLTNGTMSHPDAIYGTIHTRVGMDCGGGGKFFLSAPAVPHEKKKRPLWLR